MPLTLVVLRGTLGWILFGLQCGFCFFGVLFKACFGHKFPIVSVIVYLLMGWVAIFAMKPILMVLSIKGFMWVLYGGIFYTIGVIFFATDQKFSYFHAIWHLFVLMGSACHFILMLVYVIPLAIS